MSHLVHTSCRARAEGSADFFLSLQPYDGGVEPVGTWALPTPFLWLFFQPSCSCRTGRMLAEWSPITERQEWPRAPAEHENITALKFPRGPFWDDINKLSALCLCRASKGSVDVEHQGSCRAPRTARAASIPFCSTGGLSCLHPLLQHTGPVLAHVEGRRLWGLSGASQVCPVRVLPSLPPRCV